MVIGRMTQKQTFFPTDAGQHNTVLLSTMGMDSPEGFRDRRGRDWLRQHVCRQDTFSLVVTEGYQSTANGIGYTRQEDYVKVNFWLRGKHTTILDGFGQHEHERPEVFITSGPLEMIKVDVLNRDSQVAGVALCLKRDFFPTHMGLSTDELPDPLHGIVAPAERRYAFCRFPLTQDLAAAAKAILAAPFSLRRDPIYARAKSVELVCLLINLITTHDRKSGAGVANTRHESRLYKARQLLAERYAEPITLDSVSKEVGLNRMALTAGFRQMFGMSVYDFLQRERMERAYALLLDGKCTVAQVAEAVGFNHSCNFSTAFRRYFGCTPQKTQGPLYRQSNRNRVVGTH
jgi:AraC-like DNA-binding protein